jgi:hypothetical protein
VKLRDGRRRDCGPRTPPPVAFTKARGCGHSYPNVQLRTKNVSSEQEETRRKRVRGRVAAAALTAGLGRSVADRTGCCGTSPLPQRIGRRLHECRSTRVGLEAAATRAELESRGRTLVRNELHDVRDYVWKAFDAIPLEGRRLYVTLRFTTTAPLRWGV